MEHDMHFGVNMAELWIFVIKSRDNIITNSQEL